MYENFWPYALILAKNQPLRQKEKTKQKRDRPKSILFLCAVYVLLYLRLYHSDVGKKMNYIYKCLKFNQINVYAFVMEWIKMYKLILIL